MTMDYQVVIIGGGSMSGAVLEALLSQIRASVHDIAISIVNYVADPFIQPILFNLGAAVCYLVNPLTHCTCTKDPPLTVENSCKPTAHCWYVYGSRRLTQNQTT